MLLRKFRTYGLIFFCLLLFNASSQAQNLNLDKFSGQLRSGRYYLNFTLASGFTCYGVIIERSTDNIHYTEIGKLNGWCGHISNSVSYQFADDNPVPNKINFYRLQLGEEFNNHTTTSPIEFEYVVFDNSGITVLQKSQKHLSIFIKPSIADYITVELYGWNGALLFKAETQSNNYELQIPFLSPKSGILRLTSKRKILYSRKIFFN